MDLLIITPLYFGDGSGASVYYQRLTTLLSDNGLKIGIISDQESGLYDGIYFSLFPKRAGQARSPFKDYLSYALQNISYLRLEKLIKTTLPKNIIVHSSFYNFPGFFPAIMKRLMRKYPRVRFILDVRDHLVPNRRVKYFADYYSVIACSENIINYLVGAGLTESKLSYIPVIQEHLDCDDELAQQIGEKYNLGDARYILYAGLIKEEKRVDVLLEVFDRYIRPVMPDVKLVLIGLLKSTSGRLKALLNGEDVLYLGSLSRIDVIGLMANATMCVNLSQIESFSRSSLEAIALGKPVILPPNIPEFTECCADFVVSANEPEIIAKQMITIFESGQIPAYPISRHYPEQVICQYMRLLS